MSEISDLEGRIAAAMDRISRGVEALGAADPGASEDAAELRQALDDEKLANAQLEERVKALHSRQEELEAALAEAQAAPSVGEDKPEEASEAAAPQAGIDLEEGRALLADLARRLRRLKDTTRTLRATNQQLRDAAEAEMPDAGLINEALKADLASLQALRSVEDTEMAAIVAVLRPLLGTETPAGEADADETEEA